MSHLLENLLIFGRVLRRSGIDVPPERLIDVIHALDYVGLASRDDVYHGCGTIIGRPPEQFTIFDAAFDAFLREHGRAAARSGDDRAAGSESTLGRQAVV